MVFKLIEAASALALLPPKLHEPLADLLGRGARVADQIAVRVAGDSSIEIAERQRVAQVTDRGSASGDVTALGGEVDGEVAESEGRQDRHVLGAHVVGIDPIELDVHRAPSE